MKIFLSLLLAALPLTVLADDTIPAKAYPCTACHGVDGRKSAPGQPAIGGRPTDDLIVILRAYRQLDRVNPAMQMLLMPMSDDEIADVAEYFSQAGQRHD